MCVFATLSHVTIWTVCHPELSHHLALRSQPYWPSGEQGLLTGVCILWAGGGGESCVTDLCERQNSRVEPGSCSYLHWEACSICLLRTRYQIGSMGQVTGSIDLFSFSHWMVVLFKGFFSWHGSTILSLFCILSVNAQMGLMPMRPQSWTW